MTRPAKSPLKYHGGKSYLAKKIIDLLPPRDSWHLWREPFFGGGSVTLALNPEGLSEAVNDIDGLLMNFWQVLQFDDCYQSFLRRLEAVPFSETEFVDSRFLPCGVDTESNVWNAVAFFVRARQSRQGLGSDFATPTNRLRRGMNENVSAWLSAVEGLPDVHARLKRIEIRNMDAIDFVKKYDHERAVFYCDPPYIRETPFNNGGEYRHEMSLDDHVRLVRCLQNIQGRFLLSGYRSPLCDDVTHSTGWRRVDIPIDNKASGKKRKEIKTECVWMNY